VLLREILRRSLTLAAVEDAAIGDADALPQGHSDADLNPLPLIREKIGEDIETTDNEAAE
jgi:hypothetical protein